LTKRIHNVDENSNENENKQRETESSHSCHRTGISS